jgi:hypothetical protein
MILDPSDEQTLALLNLLIGVIEDARLPALAARAAAKRDPDEVRGDRRAAAGARSSSGATRRAQRRRRRGTTSRRARAGTADADEALPRPP